MIRHRQKQSDTQTDEQLNEVIRQLQSALDARDRTLRRIRTSLLLAGMVVIVAAFIIGTLFRDAHPLLAAAANALGGSFYLIGTFVALVEAAGRRITSRSVGSSATGETPPTR